MLLGWLTTLRSKDGGQLATQLAQWVLGSCLASNRETQWLAGQATALRSCALYGRADLGFVRSFVRLNGIVIGRQGCPMLLNMGCLRLTGARQGAGLMMACVGPWYHRNTVLLACKMAGPVLHGCRAGRPHHGVFVLAFLVVEISRSVA